MYSYFCIIQRNGRADAIRDELQKRLLAVDKETFIGDEPPAISWHLIEPGNMYSHGDPSDSAIIVRTTDPDLMPEQRARAMRGIHDVWVEATGFADHDVVIALRPTDSS